jgi:hypothetical protein
MTNFKDIQKQFLPKFKDKEIDLEERVYCICRSCQHNLEKSFCEEKCKITGGIEVICLLNDPCQIKKLNPDICDKETIRITGKPKHILNFKKPKI